MSVVGFGIDRRGDLYHTAKVRSQSGRPVVEELIKQEQLQSGRIQFEKDCNVTCGVSDNLAVIKRLRVAETGPEDQCETGRFELIQSVLESEDQLHVSVLPTRVRHRVLGIAWHKGVLPYLPVTESSTSALSIDYHSRSAALGRGYLAFCRVGQGDLMAVVDVTVDCAALCLLYRRQVADIACFDCSPDMMTRSEGMKRFALDLKTVINDKLAALRSVGVSVPLSALVISGHGVNERFRQKLTEQFPVGVLAPDMHRGYFDSGVLESTQYLSDYLVALGLALN